jgi:tetratricopeptide (TPR) repeat protein
MGMGGLFWQPLAAAWHANWGSVYQARAELAPDIDDVTRQTVLNRATTSFDRTLRLDPTHPVANRRLGMIALDRHEFEAAVAYLETAYQKESGNQGTIKALGLAYLWTGQLDRAEKLFRQVELQSQLMDGLHYWQWWWGIQDRQDLSGYAGEMSQRLSE